MSKNIILLPRADSALVNRTDGWMNALVGIGTSRDKRLSGVFVKDVMTPDQCEELYRSSDMAARIAEAIPEEMTREWVEFRVADSGDEEDDDEEKGHELKEKIMSRMEELEVQARFCEAMSTARALGGAGVLINVDDGMDPIEPLDPERVRKVESLSMLDCRELVPVQWYGDPLDHRCGLPEIYEVRPVVRGVPSIITATVQQPDIYPRVHETRVLRFDGIRTTRRARYENFGWGESVYVRIYDILRDFNISWAAAANLMTDFAQGVLKIKGLAELVAANEDEKVVKRAQLADLSRSVARMLLLDADEDFTREVAPIGGMEGMLDKFALRLAAAARMPVSLLMGQAPAGLNATGDSDIRWFYDYLKSQQKRHLKPMLDRLAVLLFKDLGIEEPENWSWYFFPLWQMTDAEKADIRQKTSAADASDISAGILLPEEVAISRYGGDEYSTDTSIDIKLRKSLKAHRGEVEEAKLVSEKENQQNPEPPPGVKYEDQKNQQAQQAADRAKAKPVKKDEDGDEDDDEWHDDFDESKHPRHPAGAPGGRGGEFRRVKGRVWEGERSRHPLKNQLTKHQTGALGEQIAEKYLRSMGITKITPLHDSAANNFPVDIFANGDMLIEVKAGLVSSTNPKWKIQLNGLRHGDAEKAMLARMSPERKRRYNAKKRAAAMQRKMKVLAAYRRLHGTKVRPVTISVIIDTDARTVDVHWFEGFHLSVGWSGSQAKQGYRGTFRW